MDFTEDNAAELGETLGLMGFLHSSVGKESACNAGDPASIPGLGRSPGEHGNTLQYSCLENSYGWRCLAGYAHGVTNSQTRLSDFGLAWWLRQ